MISLLDPHRVGAHTVVGVTGEIDVATAPALRDRLLGLLNRGVASLVLDLRGVTFVDSTGVGSLLRIHHRQALLGGSVHFVADQSAVLRVFDLMQLRRHLHVTPTVADVDECCPTLRRGVPTVPVLPATVRIGEPHVTLP
jgi:anti-sigma B factor antagonist